MAVEFEAALLSRFGTESLIGVADDLEAVDKRLGSLIESNPEDPVTKAASHLLAHRGKLFRPLAVLLACEAVGGERKTAIGAAVAIELAHISSLVHDDIIDRDLMRRSVPAVHSLWGESIGLLAGDYLLIKAYEVLTSCAKTPPLSSRQVIRALEVACRCGLLMCIGEGIDVIAKKESFTIEQYMSVLKRKTGALVGGAMELGAIMGGGDDEQIAILGNFGVNMGVSFQIVDDIIGVVSEKDVSGKPFGSDIRNGKPTLILFHALSTANDANLKDLRSTIGNPDATDSEVKKAIEVFDTVGSIKHARETALKYCDAAKRFLEKLPDTQPRRLLCFLADLAVNRRS